MMDPCTELADRMQNVDLGKSKDENTKITPPSTPENEQTRNPYSSSLRESMPETPKKKKMVVDLLDSYPNEKYLTLDESWEIVKAFSNEEAFSNDSVRSYDQFIENLRYIPIPLIEVEADAANLVHKGSKHTLRFTNLTVGRPIVNEDDPNKKNTFLILPKTRNRADNLSLLSPFEALERALTYAMPIYYDVEHDVYQRVDEAYLASSTTPGIVTTSTTTTPSVVEVNVSGSLNDLSKSTTTTTETTQAFTNQQPSTPSVSSSRPKKDYKLIKHKVSTKVCVGEIPVAVGSKWCNLDILPEWKQKECPYQKKGCFIVNGMERIIIPQARMEHNTVFVFRKTNPKNYLLSEIRSRKENDFSDPAVIKIKYKAYKGRGEPIFKLKFPYSQYEVNVAVVFRALGIETEGEIMDMILQGSNNEKMKYLCKPTLEHQDALAIRDQFNALLHIGKKSQSFTTKDRNKFDLEQIITNYAGNLLGRDLFPHMGKTREYFRQKAFYLGYMVNKMLRVQLGIAEPDNRDHCERKSFELAGPLLEEVFNQAMNDMTREIKASLGKWIRDGKPVVDVVQSNVMKKRTITPKLSYAVATGNWTANSNKRTNKTGVTAVWSRVSFASSLSHMRRLNTPIGREGKLSKPRQLQWDQWGMIDPGETPEGSNVGFVNNFATLCHVSMGVSSFHLMDVILDHPGMKRLEDITDRKQVSIELKDNYRIFVNGRWIGVMNHSDAYKLMTKLRSMKRSLDINYETSIAWKLKERSVFIRTDAGRVMRPLLVVDDPRLVPLSSICRPEKKSSSGTNGGPRIIVPTLDSLRFELNEPSITNPDSAKREEKDTLPVDSSSSEEHRQSRQNHHHGRIRLTRERVMQLAGTRPGNYKDSLIALMAEGYVELLDVSEEDNAMIAMFVQDLTNPENELVRYTHCEIHPCTIYGEIAGGIPFSNHDPSPRITHQSAMGKQAIGVPMVNYDDRMDTMMHVLNYPQKPMTTTKIWKLNNMDELPSGVECVVMIACLDGYNMEDAIYISRRFLDNGAFRNTYYRTYRDSEQKGGNANSTEEFKKPDPESCFSFRPMNHEHLGSDGIVDIDEFVSQDDSIIGKVVPYTNAPNDSRFSEKDHSTGIRNGESGYVDKVMITTNEAGFRYVKVRVRSQLIPTVGDKFSARHGQKGVIGSIIEPEDLPWSVQGGLVPDIIINPHAKPSRMTIGMILEMLAGKIGCLSGKGFDATAFEDCFFNDDEEDGDDDDDYRYHPQPSSKNGGDHDDDEKHSNEPNASDETIRNNKRDAENGTVLHTTQRKLENMLAELGYKRGGEEMFHNGRTGEMFETPLFVGTCYYQRLKHLVNSKIHARAKGPVDPLTRQPTEGRMRDGGLRFGEMERDCTIAYGAAMALNMRMLHMSDVSTLLYCKRCGHQVYRNAHTKSYHCSKCTEPKNEIIKILAPHVWKVLTNELVSMGIIPRLKISEDFEPRERKDT